MSRAALTCQTLLLLASSVVPFSLAPYRASPSAPASRRARALRAAAPPGAPAAPPDFASALDPRAARHATLPADAVARRVLVVGDVHGCDAELGLLLSRLAYDPAADALVLAGDLVNKGPASAAVVRRVRALAAAPDARVYAVAGNHEARRARQGLREQPDLVSYFLRRLRGVVAC